MAGGRADPGGHGLRAGGPLAADLASRKLPPPGGAHGPLLAGGSCASWLRRVGGQEPEGGGGSDETRRRVASEERPLWPRPQRSWRFRSGCPVRKRVRRSEKAKSRGECHGSRRRRVGAEGGTRTPTGEPPLRPERSASTSSATSAAAFLLDPSPRKVNGKSRDSGMIGRSRQGAVEQKGCP
jgi:hypothetical protein